MLSIIIPTMQKDLDVLNKLLCELEESDVVGEVVVIDNSCKGFNSKFSKVRVFTQKENLFVNPATLFSIQVK